MVIRHSVNDWYTNAEGRSGAEFRYDWENDDQPDRTPDSWLDRHQSVGRVAASRPTRATVNRSAPGTSSRRNDSTQRELANAARALQARMRGVKDQTLARHLRQGGWAGVTAEQVRDALRAHPEEQQAPGIHILPGKPDPPRKKQQSHGTITVINPPTVSRTTARTSKPARTTPSMAEVARALRAKDPKISIEKLTKQVQARGWVTATVKKVRTALKEPPRPAPARKQQKTATPRQTRPTVVALPAARAPHPDACFACGVVPSLLGTCRCS
ncbi:hypothetical protein [Micromonospora echinospora]|uniref:hypothetical protein n=1 Tax=Micromonospora echinospora TaxID=1877 RepID=UPI00366B2F0D